MALNCGIVGLPNVGKSTIFQAITSAPAEAANYPFCTIEPNVGTVPVPDERLGMLEKIYNSKRVVPAFIDFVDIAGLVEGASRGEGLGNKFLSHIREVSAIVHVVRCFEDKDVIHVDSDIDPQRDIETINTELILADIESMERRIEKQKKSMKASKDKKQREELEIMERLTEHLQQGRSARSFSDDEDIVRLIDSYFLLSSKPVIYAANVSEEELGSDLSGNNFLNVVHKIASEETAEVVVISAKVEEEIAQLDDEEKVLFLEELGLKNSGLDRLVEASYRLLGLFSFLTAGEKEVRAWTIPLGIKAPQAAGKIHTDFERGFIRAEIINYDDLVKLGSESAAREKGKIRVEGKDYVMRENDVVNFRFNV